MSSGGEAFGRLRLLFSAVGPRDQWRAEEDKTAWAQNTLSIRACMEAGADESMLGCWFRGIKLEFRHASLVIALQDYPSVRHEAEAAAA